MWFLIAKKLMIFDVLLAGAGSLFWRG